MIIVFAFGEMGLGVPEPDLYCDGMMLAPSTGATRIVRGLVCAVVCLLLGSLAHGLAGGGLPSPTSMILAFGALAAVGIALADRQRDFRFITAVLGGAQLLLHVGFVLVAAIGAAGHEQHELWAAPAGSAVTSGRLGPHATMGLMVAGHVAATLISAACMTYAERVVWRLARMVLPPLPFLLTPPQAIPLAVASGGPDTGSPVRLPARHGVLLARRRPRRGPPRYGAALTHARCR
ncbi:MAG: hypothetical protein ACRDOO_21080 [Actinomadura sp.]